MKPMKTTHRWMISLLLLLAGSAAQADAELQSFLDKTLNEIRTRANLPAVAALVQIDGKVEARSAVGVRAAGHPEPVTAQDLWHLGSDTKAMTATLIARLVEQGYLSYDDTMAKIFPGVAARMNPEMNHVTVAQLLTHTSGLPSLSTPEQMPAFEAVIRSERGPRAQRAALVVHYLSRKPATKVGEFSYSNIGYAIAGAVAEERTGKSWEELMRSEVWRPLGIRGAGFGPPGRSGRFDQPLGHEMKDGKWRSLDPEARDSDNPPAIGPAGTVHITLDDWLRFAQDHLDGELGTGKLLKPESYRRLHTPVAKNYAMGWGVLHAKDGSTTVITHTGSNGYWVADVRIFPKHQMILLITMNAGGEVAEKADKDIARALQDHLKALD
jgi:CubicO group peptidase (beta-lactamase class C family)